MNDDITYQGQINQGMFDANNGFTPAPQGQFESADMYNLRVNTTNFYKK